MELREYIKILKKADNINKESFDRDSNTVKKRIAEAEAKTKEYKLKIAEKEKVSWVIERWMDFMGKMS